MAQQYKYCSLWSELYSGLEQSGTVEKRELLKVGLGIPEFSLEKENKGQE